MSDLPPLAVEHLTLNDLWKEKDRLVKREFDAQKFWASIADDERAAVILLVRDAMLRLLKDPDKWVPTSVQPRDGNRLDVTFSIFWTDVDEGALAKRVDLERLREHTAEQLLGLERTLRTMGDQSDD